MDWVEKIPFSETRNYVQRIMENLQVYRARFGGGTRLQIEADLRQTRELRGVEVMVLSQPFNVESDKTLRSADSVEQALLLNAARKLFDLPEDEN